MILKINACDKSTGRQKGQKNIHGAMNHIEFHLDIIKSIRRGRQIAYHAKLLRLHDELRRAHSEVIGLNTFRVPTDLPEWLLPV